MESKEEGKSNEDSFERRESSSVEYGIVDDNGRSSLSASLCCIEELGGSADGPEHSLDDTRVRTT